MPTKEHGLLLFLPPELQLGIIKLQASKEMGRSFAGLLTITEGLYNMKFISEETYQIYKKRYSHKLVDEAQTKLQSSDEFVQARREIDNMTKTFSMVLDQWALHPQPEWRSKWVEKARQYEKRIPQAKLILDLNNSGKIEAKKH